MCSPRGWGLYHDAAQRLIDSGHAYRCYCTPERLNEVRLAQQERGDETIGYDGRCLELSERERSSRECEGAPSVVRIRMPDEGTSALDDIIFGHLEFENRLYDDFIALKSDGFPTYHFASVVDDHSMGITHVTRAKEWLSSIPRHVQLYAAFGWEMPAFAHMPVILAPDKSKLSKRHGAASVMDYRDMGVLPSALMNYLALLGWSLDDRTEVFSPDELIESFELARVSKSDAVFDLDKLLWINGQHIRRSSNAELADHLGDYWSSAPPEFDMAPTSDQVAQVTPLVRERLKTLDDAAPLVNFVFSNEVSVNTADLSRRGWTRNPPERRLRPQVRVCHHSMRSTHPQIEAMLRPLAKELGIKTGQLLGTLRAATTGRRCPLQSSSPSKCLEETGR